MAIYKMTLKQFRDHVHDDAIIWIKDDYGLYSILKLYFLNPGFKLCFWKNLSLLVNGKRKHLLSIAVHHHYKKIQKDLSIELPYNLDIKGGMKLDHTIGIVINGFATIGKNFIIKQNSTIVHDDKGTPTIGDNVWIGPNCVLIGKINIGDNAIVGGGSIVTHDVKPNSIVVGNPARHIRFQSSEEVSKLHY